MNKQQNRVGCYGSLIDCEPGKNSVIQLPLQKISYEFEIMNGVAEVFMHQTFVNKNQKYLQVEYKFPITPSICLYKFVATFGKTRIEGVVKQKQAAKVEYKEAVSSGKKAALGSIDPESKDIMILHIGNIGPNEEVQIQLCYCEELSINLNTFYQFSFSTKLIPRYINSIPPQDYLSAFRNSVQTVGGQFQWDLRLKVHASRKVVSYKSPTHQLTVEKCNDQRTELQLTLDKGESLAKQFTFLFTTQQFELPSYTLGRTDISSSVMVSFIPKFCTLDLKDAELAALNSESFETDMDAVRGQYIFLLDRSGSMGGSPIEKAKEALILFLKSLPIDTYFQVVSFGSGSKSLFPSSQKNSNQSIGEAVATIKTMSADMGGTEIYPPLGRILKSAIIEGYPKQIFLLTDGGVSNTEKVIDLVRQNTKYSRIHTIGVGGDVSKALIIGCAQKGKGQHIFIGNGENPAEKIIQLLNGSLTPVISKVALSYDADIVESIVPNPQRLPYILKGEVVNFYLTFKGHLTKHTSIGLSYTDSLNSLPFKSEVEVSPDSPSQPIVEKMANFKRIKALEDAEEANGNIEDFLYFAKAIDKKQQIIELSTKYQILSKYTAFLCVEKELIDGRYEQIVGKGQLQIQVVQVVNAAPKKQELDFANFFGTASSSNYSQFNAKPSIPQPAMPGMSNMLSMDIKKADDALYKKKTFNKLFGLGDSGGSSSNSSGIKAPPPPPPPPPSLFGDNFFQPNQVSPPPPPSFNLPPPPSSISFNLPPPSLPTTSISMQPSSLFSMAPSPPSLIGSLPPPACSAPPMDLMCQQRPMEMKKAQINNKLFGGMKVSSNVYASPVVAPVAAKKTVDKIEQVVSQQQFEGKWSKVELIERLFGGELAIQIEGVADREVAITVLVVGWIEKHHKEKVYALILKKAINWLKKQQKYPEYQQAYQKYIQ